MGRRALASVLIMIISFTSGSFANSSSENLDNAVESSIVVVDTIAHDSNSFTQGLEYYNGTLLESSGLYGSSSIRQVNPANGEIIRSLPINESLFAEGITVKGDSIIMLTWKEELALEIDIEDFRIIGNYTYQGEGWGICFNGDHFVTSNGSSVLSYRDQQTFETNYSVNITWDGELVQNLNELECVNDKIYANIWMQDTIIVINSTTGMVEMFASAKTLSENHEGPLNEVLNGIALDHNRDGFWITGKNWSEMYLVNFESISENQTNKKDSLILIQILDNWTTLVVLLSITISLILSRLVMGRK
ncbi:MAG: glutaminyl-peptide cyclotransferase [Candidatus Thermoplasmatota archaeon]|nr:glutaminyl-peptide cyclotransferase [Candidatus Thermoplasmatota archaeon]